MTTEQKKTQKEIGESLKLARLHARLSLPETAFRAGMSKGNLSKIEHGGNLRVDTLYRLCRVLDIHPRYVLPDFKKL